MGSANFTYTGGSQTWTVPGGVTSVTVDMAGGSGVTSGLGIGGKGGRTQVTVTANPGDIWQINVGGAGSGITGGFNGGGNGVALIPTKSGSIAASGAGGGASDIRVPNSSPTLANRTVVAGGAGGGGVYASVHGSGGGGNGPNGDNGTSNGAPPDTVAGGGTQIGGGAGSIHSSTHGNAGALGTGGNGSQYPSQGSGGGGGGGLYGGGGGLYAAGGGGGSCYGPGSPTYTDAFQSGNGYVSLTWVDPPSGVTFMSPMRLT